MRAYIANETRSDEERRDLTEQLHHQLDKLATDAKRVKQDLQVSKATILILFKPKLK